MFSLNDLLPIILFSPKPKAFHFYISELSNVNNNEKENDHDLQFVGQWSVSVPVCEIGHRFPTMNMRISTNGYMHLTFEMNN